MQGLDWQTVHLPLLGGLEQQADARALQPPQLAIAKDVQFEERGGIQTRYPFAATGANILGGGTISNARRIVRYAGEWLLFTSTAIYSWNAQLSKWVSRGTHLAVAVDERPVFATTGDQIDGDRAELGGAVVFAWVDASGLWVAAEDTTTGSILMTPTLANAVGIRPRLVALSTKILLFWVDTAANDLECIAIDPAAPATAVAGAATTVFAASNLYYDVVKIPGVDTAIGANRRTVTTSYEVWKVTAALVVSTSTKARVCTGPVALSCDPTGVTVQIVRQNAVSIQGDRLTVSSLADAATGQAIGTAVGAGTNQIAACHRSVQDSGAYRCYVFWHDGQAVDISNWFSNVNYVDTAGSIGTSAVFIRRLAIASRAFDYEGRVFVWGAFAGESSFTGANPANFRAQLQNTYFLYRDDATLHSKAAPGRAGGFPSTVGRLPHVARRSGSTYAWCGTERRVIDLGGAKHTGYADRGPREISITFDDNRARRCVQLGRTLYIAGGEILQYDGVALVEVGFHVVPWTFGTLEVAAGSLADGAYTHKATWRSENAVAELDRSTTATHGNVTIAAGPNGAQIASFVPLYTTHKTGVAVEVWRTAVAPTTDAPFYLVTSKDPASTSNPNRYLANDTTASVLPTFNDELSDADATDNETNSENGAVLENLAPPPATIIATYGSRIFLGGVAGQPRRIWYSKLRAEGEVASFHEALTIELPLAGGDLVALDFLDGTLVAFCETATYAIPGDGFDNFGGGSNYGPARAVSYDVGCRDHDSVAVTPGGIVFHSAKGKYLLTRGYTMQYIGGAVSDYDSEAVLATHVDEKQHHVRFLTGSRMLVWDYQAESRDSTGQWAEWTISGAVHAAILGSAYHYLASTGPLALQTSYSALTYGLDVETAWIKPSDLQGFARIRHMMLLGEYRSAFYLRARISYNYDTTVIDDRAWTVTPTTVGGPLQVKIFPTRGQCEAIKLRLTAVASTTLDTATLSETVVLSDGAWTGRLLGVVPRSFTIAFEDGATARVEVRDDQTYDGTEWIAEAGCCGVVVTGRNSTAPVAIATIEAAITARSRLVSVSAAHANPAATVDFDSMAGVSSTPDAFAEAFPTGEALKLTGLSLEVGFKRGLHRRLAANRRV